MRIFLAATSLAPSYGGPAFSVSALAEALQHAGVTVGLWAADGSAAATRLLSEDSGVLRLQGEEGRALDQFGHADAIHDNGLWRPHNHRLAALAVARGIPRVVSTRGMLEPWAMRHKRWKKALAWRAYQARDLRSAQSLHATSDAEASGVERLNLGLPVSTIPNGVDLGPKRRRSKAALGGVRTAFFLGRIYPVKGLPMLIEAWARVRPLGWRLQIAGPDEAGHLREVQQAVALAGLEGDVTFSGELDASAKTAALSAADLMILPSFSESFGMAVAEGLAHGLPVLTTTAAPWPGLETRGCGWRVSPSVEGLAAGLRQALGCDRDVLYAMGDRGRDFVAADFGWPMVARRFAGLYADITADRPVGARSRRGPRKTTVTTGGDRATATPKEHLDR